MERKKKKVTYVVLVLFLAGMAVMTLVSRGVNATQIPEVETVPSASGYLKIPALGRGVVESGKLQDARLASTVFVEDTVYVRGYFYDKAYAQSISAGDEVFLSVGGGETVRGLLAAKMYDYREDIVEAVIFPEEGEYEVGAEVDFVREEARVRAACHIPNEVIYEDENGERYIYILETREGIAGNVTVAVRMDIHIVLQNQTRTAIAEELEANVKIIKKDEVLRDGLRVREREW